MSGYTSDWTPAPSAYWTEWNEECQLADHIVVNSSWSRRALEGAGIRVTKMTKTALQYESPRRAAGFVKHYPKSFCKQRPMRVLFLGQISVRKGAIQLFEAARLLKDEPIEFWLVGPISVRPTGNIAKNIRLTGPVSRSAVDEFYERADGFILPTFSDGFGLTQLEAQAWKLPIIASEFCGEVVQQNQTGIILDEITPQHIAEVLLDWVKNPARLQSFSDRIVNCAGADVSLWAAQLDKLVSNGRSRSA
jgi:glycosyltransferase involved in cell wall biosynthesis